MNEDIRDIKGPVTLPFELIDFWWVLLVVLLLLSVGLYFYFKRKKEKPEPIVPVVPPDEEALQQLNHLKEEQLPRAGKVQEYFFRLSSIVRHYLERQFGVPASEQTTEEFLIAMTHSDVLIQKQKTILESFLQQADLVKFAKYQASLKECDEGEDVARKLIEETRTRGVRI